VQVKGEVYDGPYPAIENEVPAEVPSGTTPGCVVRTIIQPDCIDIGKCGAESSVVACAKAAVTGVNPCVCVAKNTCQAYPTKRNVGAVTVSGVATTSGETTFALQNLSNSYQTSTDVTLAYPGIVEGEPIEIAANGGDYAPFKLSGTGIAPLTLTNEPYRFARDATGVDPNQYQPITITWTPPVAANTRIEVELNLSRHAGTSALLICDVEDNGSLTITSNLISQLIAVGGVAGFPELNVTRSISTFASVVFGKVELLVESNVERFVTVEGYATCLTNSECSSGEVCNTAIKLCQAQ
jgi:Cys-rich repeat protein